MHQDAAAVDRLLQRQDYSFQTRFRYYSTGKDGKSQITDFLHVTDGTINYQTGDPAPLRHSTDVASCDRVGSVAAIDHEHRPCWGPVDRRMQHQIIARSAADRIGRPAQPSTFPQRANVRGQDLRATDVFGNGCGRNEVRWIGHSASFGGVGVSCMRSYGSPTCTGSKVSVLPSSNFRRRRHRVAVASPTGLPLSRCPVAVKLLQ